MWKLYLCMWKYLTWCFSCSKMASADCHMFCHEALKKTRGNTLKNKIKTFKHIYHFQTFTLVNFQTFPVRKSHFQLHVQPWSSKKDSNIFWIHIGQVHSSPLTFLGFLGKEPDIVSDFLNTVSTSQARVRKTSSACQHCYPESFCKNPKTVRTIQKLSVQSRNCPDNPETLWIIQKLRV